MELRATEVTDIPEILELHYRYQVDSISEDDKKDGFITTPFTAQQLEDLINKERGICIAKDEGNIIAYAMAASWQFWSIWPIFEHMIEDLSNLSYMGRAISVQETVAGLVRAHHKIPHRPANIALIGHQKDNSSYYLSLFPQWSAVGVQNQKNLNATQVREGLLGGDDSASSGLDYLNDTGRAVLPAGSLAHLSAFCQSSAYKNLCQEKAFVETYKKAWEAAPYPPTFVTVDGVVIQSGHVLLIERKAFPGKGMLALPGGFLDGGEKLEDACLRELREETKLKVPTAVPKGSIKDRKVFDDPHRSMRGRTITHAFLIVKWLHFGGQFI
jgi:ADP-ribose pyrophosphatase YjhB (NUDIX family)